MKLMIILMCLDICFKKFVTIQLHPIFIRFALLTYREYASEVETNESGAHPESRELAYLKVTVTSLG